MISLTDTLQDWTAERLIDEYGDELLRLCLFYMGDRQLAEDAFQETMVKRGVPRKIQGRKRDENMAVSYCRQYLSGYAPKRMVQDAGKRACRWMSCRNWSSRRTSMRGDCRRRAEPAGKIPRGHGAVL